MTTSNDRASSANPVSLSSELWRKLVHIGFGFCALLLRWMTPAEAALLAGSAVLFNWLLLPHLGGRRIARHERGYDLGIVLYPLAVLAFIGLFHRRLDLAGICWAILAFGDGSATLLGRTIGGPKLPWNRDKSWVGFLAFIEVGFGASWLISGFIGGQPTFLSRLAIIWITVLVAAIVETLPLRLDDNLTVPIATVCVLWTLVSVRWVHPLALNRVTVIWLIADLFLAIVGYLLGSVDLSGLIGGAVLGGALIVFAGWEMFLVLLTFFILGSALTRLGWERKASRGVAQEKGGRRGFGHAFANVGVASLAALALYLLPLHTMVLWLAAVGALATAAADTTGSEIGQWIGKRAFLPMTLQSVPPGTEGAISWEGTTAGIVASFLVASVGVWGLMHRLHGSGALVAEPLRAGKLILIVTLAGFAGSYLESLIGNWNRRQSQSIPNGALNFINTAIGGALAATGFVLFRGAI